MKLLKDKAKREMLEADLQEYYGVDLVDYYRGRLPLRRLVVLTAQLRPGARVYEDWATAEHFAVDQIDLLNIVVWQNYMIASSLGVKKKYFKNPPKRVKRPRDINKPIRFSKTADVKALLGQ